MRREIRDLYQLRGLLDGFAGRQAAQLPATKKSALLAVLDDSIDAMQDAASQHDVQRYYGENLRFHWAIVESAGNQSLTETYRGIVQKLHLSRLKNLSQDVGMQVSIAEHVEIVQAVREGDPLRCDALMARHVGDAYERLSTAAPSDCLSPNSKPKTSINHNGDNTMKRRTLLQAAPALLAPPAWPAQAAYPAKPIRYIVPVAAGGGSDMVGRTVTERWGQAAQAELRRRQPGRRRRHHRLPGHGRAPRPTATR